MIIYKDFLTGDELFTDIYPMKLVGPNQNFIQLKGKRVTENSSAGDINIGGNPSAEEAAETTEETSVSGVDIVLANRLTEVTEYTKEAYQQDKIKPYIKKLMKAKDDQIKELEAEGKKNEKLVEELKLQYTAFKNTFKEDLKSVILTGFKKKEFQFFLGESLSDEAMLILMTYPEDDPEGRPLMYFVKYGLKEVKV
ncbi:translationally-controlled tumor protein homolog [Strongylocentrotus purpuratus]|uniref:TCTP domain-containing protein n=1 Tax=Strongylocentrotus purpuratus TaxID=7668 RepID=A0A7M7NR60_STRPU|nr:translationally-controlled tumor protein homolog [Strongylocentrotus purpuratus]XP_030838312.1 translationally-controlled tumor protein homolog [Strongylocentrotus purpuratus]|eukprot:XP_795619.2 PREDICTED: translationally-controlled tumor protein homolog [Strongylocentrotus purpuratus]